MNNAIAAIKRLFAKPSALVIAQEELEDAKREQLAALNATEFYQAQAQYQAKRIARLTDYLGGAK